MEQDYEFSYSDKDLFDHGPGTEWCPLFGELPIVFITPRRKHPVADRCIDIIIAARSLWEKPYPYLVDGAGILLQEQIALSNPNWPELDEIPEYGAAILAARSIALWNHYHIVTNALNYCQNTQVPYPRHWHENDAGILHYARTSMNHFSYPPGVENEKCLLLMYPPGSPEEAALKVYDRNIEMQEEASQVPDACIFAALAIREAWEILRAVLHDGVPESSADIKTDLSVANKLLEKAQQSKIAHVQGTLDRANVMIEQLVPDAELGAERRRHAKKMASQSAKERHLIRVENERAWTEAAKHISRNNSDKSREWVIGRIIQKFGLDEKRRSSIRNCLKKNSL